MLKVTNSLSKKKEVFQPLVPGKVKLYVCGMTVYDHAHIGHARTYVVFDMVARYLRHLGYEVDYVRNITDIDDKIIQRAEENAESFDQLTARFIQAFETQEAQLFNQAPNQQPRATAYIAQMLQLIERLLDRGYAYVAEDGVYFQVSQFKDYGKLSHQDVEQLRAGARVDVLDSKQDPLDFALWKLTQNPDEPSWDSPWGAGRPGWHIECSAMSYACLGAHIDIHGGGNDLIFPHHQNELAQSEAAHGAPFVKYWLHSGHVRVNDVKMSKSLNNFFTIKDVLEQYPAEVLRYFLLASYYRSPINYSEANLESAKKALERFYHALLNLPEIALADTESPLEFEQQFYAAMDDDFNTPEALAAMFEAVREINRLKAEARFEEAAKIAARLKRLGRVLGLLQQSPAEFLKVGQSVLPAEQVEGLIAERNQARKEKNWQRADEIRQQLSNQGIQIEDTAEGTIWRQA